MRGREYSSPKKGTFGTASGFLKEINISWDRIVTSDPGMDNISVVQA